MQMRASKIVFDLAGSPPQEDCFEAGKEELCKVCGEPQSRGMPFSDWQGANFTDQNKVEVYGRDWVCEICVYAHSWTPPPRYGEVENRGPNLRMFSHFWDDHDGYDYYKKKYRFELFERLITAVALKRSFFCAISESGQKHTLPWTDVNEPGGRWVRFENRDVKIGKEFVQLTRWCSTVYTVKGVRLDDIRNGQTYRPPSWAREPELLHEFEKRWADWRG